MSSFRNLSKNEKIEHLERTNIEEIGAWLKDVDRLHDEAEDLEILLRITSSNKHNLDILISKGIRLPPPIRTVSIHRYVYIASKDFIYYITRYAEYPSREMTENEKKELVHEIMNVDDSVNDEIDILIDLDLLPEFNPKLNNNNDTNTDDYSDGSNNGSNYDDGNNDGSNYNDDDKFDILDNLQRIKRKTVIKLIQKNISKLKKIGFPALKKLFNDYIKYYTKQRKISLSMRAPTNFEDRAIESYTAALNEIEKVEHSKKLHTFLETIEPNSHLYRLPKNLIPNVTEYVYGTKYRNYKGGRTRNQKRKHSVRKTRSNRK